MAKIIFDYQKTISQLKETISTDLNLNTLAGFNENLNSAKSSILELIKMENLLNDKETKFNQIANSIQALNTNGLDTSKLLVDKLQALSLKYEDYFLNIQKIIFKTIDQYIIYNEDNSDTNFTGMVYCPYSSSCSDMQELKNNKLNTGVALGNGTGCLIIEKTGTFNELIFGGSAFDEWNTGHWNSVSILFLRNHELVALYRLTQANSNLNAWNGIYLDNLNITKIIITGYCAFSKIAFK